jgi:beta-glucanase (GH16 family)
VSAPTFSTTAAQNGAVIVAMATSTGGAAVHYTIDGSTPDTSSPTYQAPILISTNLTIKAIGTASGDTSSSVTSWTSPAITSGALIWSDEFNSATTAQSEPDPNVWGYDTGAGGWGNSELEDYCSWNSSISPCTPTNPNAYVSTDGYLHVRAAQPTPGVYTSARLKSEGLFSILYGRVEARIQVPEAQGFWPAFWLLGNNIVTDSWPTCGEMDIQERVNAPGNPDYNVGSIHGPGFTGTNLGTTYNFPAGQTAGGWHTYGMIWQPGKVEYYIDSPTNIYATFTPSSITGFSGSSWPFDSGNGRFFIINLAVGGNYPGNPDGTTPFPSEMLVDYVRVYAN